MVLNSLTTKKITEFIKIKPRSIQEIATHINKNWRTASRYVEIIENENGTIATRTFRKGTRGALKIVFWNFSDDIHSLSFQEDLLKNILRGNKKEDFSPFEIFQHISKENKKAFIENASVIDPEIKISQDQDLKGLFQQASKQIFIFAGNCSWINSKQDSFKMEDIIREQIKRNVSIKIIAKVAMVGIENIKKLLSLNQEIGKDLIEIRHRSQPLRAMLIDNKVVKFKEREKPEYHKPGELKEKISIFYNIYDKDWNEWLIKVFYKMFTTAIPAQKRIEEIELIKNIEL